MALMENRSVSAGSAQTAAIQRRPLKGPGTARTFLAGDHGKKHKQRRIHCSGSVSQDPVSVLHKILTTADPASPLHNIPESQTFTDPQKQCDQSPVTHGKTA